MRPEILFPYFADLESLPGLGPKTSPLVARLIGGSKVVDLLFHLPVNWVDRRPRASFAETRPDEIATVRGTVHSVKAGHGSAPARIILEDDTGFLTLVYFRAQPAWLQKSFPMNAEKLVSGRIEDFQGGRQMVHPDHVVDADKDASSIPEVEPVYRMAAGVTGRLLQKVIASALETLPEMPPWTDAHLADKEKWPEFLAALRILHQPDHLDLAAFDRARRRLAYDEALSREIAIAQGRLARDKMRARPIPVHRPSMSALLDALPFQPTRAQLSAFDAISKDMASPTPMRRLLQGDVGAGKTLVAALAISQAAAAGRVTAFMSPTEVLARQQAEALDRFLSPIGYRCLPLTGRDKAAVRRETLERVASGEAVCLSGTQALYQDSTQVPNLGLVIIDEQHRFGVVDRLKLSAKGEAPHVLMMSATPIPRSLGLALHGDLDTSVLDEKPAGRSPVTTAVAPDTRIEEVIDAVARAAARGERAFWVCPAVDAEDAEDAAATVRQKVLSDRVRAPVALVHGRMPATEKDAALEAFRTGAAKVLVATTVVEVGVDVPEATIMVIERADKFGLAQLHQLRGRVGRGDKPSSCLLLYKPPLTDLSKQRLETLRRTEDGFEIAEADFKLRGPGDLLGLRQSGLPNFRILDLMQDADYLAVARKDAQYLVAQDPKLTGERGQAARLLRDLFAPRVRDVVSPS